MKGRVLFALLMVVLVALLATAVFADGEEPTTPACTSPGWWLGNVTTTYTDTNTILELSLDQENADHSFSNAGWTDVCFLCENLIEIRYQTNEMEESAAFAKDEIECEDASTKLKIERKFGPNVAPIKLWFEINFKSAVSDQAYTLKWAQSECGGTVKFFNCEGPPTAVDLEDFNAMPLKLPSPAWIRWLYWLWRPWPW